MEVSLQEMLYAEKCFSNNRGNRRRQVNLKEKRNSGRFYNRRTGELRDNADSYKKRNRRFFRSRIMHIKGK